MSKALKISDLAVGDWVKVGGGLIAQVEYPRLRHDQVGVRFAEPFRAQAILVEKQNVELEYIHPIPITPEILKKNEVYVRWQCVAADPIGALFKNDETYHTKCEKFYKSSDFVIHSTLRGERFGRWQFATNDMRRGFKGRTVLANINYVHELQQALRLAGINKEIVL